MISSTCYPSGLHDRTRNLLDEQGNYQRFLLEACRMRTREPQRSGSGDNSTEYRNCSWCYCSSDRCFGGMPSLICFQRMSRQHVFNVSEFCLTAKPVTIASDRTVKE